MSLACLLTLALIAMGAAVAQPAPSEIASVRVRFTDNHGPLNIDHMALGQGGLSDSPMWADRVAEVRALRPKMIRLFVQEYFNLLAQRGSYHFSTLDKSVDTIVAAGAEPLMCICFKPHALFPKVDQDVVEPADYGAWEDLVVRLVRHFLQRGVHIRYWEVGNEPDLGEDGGCPYRFKPESYVRYYGHTASAILRADSEARIGGPAVADCHSPLLPALLDAAEHSRLPLSFVSWHTYSSDPGQIRRTVEHVRSLLSKHPALKVETVLDEWNMDLMNPSLDPRFQPCFVLETIWQMKDAGLDWSCYYHIRDWHVEEQEFVPFMSPQGVAFMARWWNRMPQFDGLFDYQNTVRPSYFALKLLARLAGDALGVSSDSPKVHAFATHDSHYRTENLLVWNYSPNPVRLDLSLMGVPGERLVRRVTLDATTGSSDQNARLRPSPSTRLTAGDHRWQVELAPWGIEFWSFE